MKPKRETDSGEFFMDWEHTDLVDEIIRLEDDIKKIKLGWRECLRLRFDRTDEEIKSLMGEFEY